LEYLILEGCRDTGNPQIGDVGGAALARALASMPGLTSLGLENNRFWPRSQGAARGSQGVKARIVVGVSSVAQAAQPQPTRCSLFCISD
jgi:hypothetical protein